MSINTMQAATESRPMTKNLLLARLAHDDLALLAEHLEAVKMHVHDVLFEPGANIEHVYFPTAGCISLINATQHGTVEVGTIGFEGFAGMSVLLRGSSAPTQALVQIEGEAFRMRADVFLRIVMANERLQRVLLRSSLAFFNQVAQSVVCNRLHSLEERCARWLLITHDRVDGDQFKLTQEFLSFMLGVHRPAVTLAAGVLQRAGYIHYSRGNITITDRAGLETVSCSCYQIVRDDLASLTN